MVVPANAGEPAAEEANAGEPAAEEPFLRTPSCPDVLRFCSLCLRFLSVGTSFKSITGLSIRNTWDPGCLQLLAPKPSRRTPRASPWGADGPGKARPRSAQFWRRVLHACFSAPQRAPDWRRQRTRRLCVYLCIRVYLGLRVRVS